ncbi:MAG: phosphoribosylglycinamide formyltransferase [Candidatus Competibacteraceae bacterium]|nr:phosphoribosylglycinamide formyltransferase [Candidatus Competibacteraceae bacterium]
MRKLPIVVLVSGRGSNLQAILDGAGKGDLPVDIRAVISNRPDVYALERARQSGVPALTLDHKAYPDRQNFETALQAMIDDCKPELVILAGFMRVLSAAFVEYYGGRLLNIHPSLLPKYRGLHTHERALAAGEQEHGASVHFVTPELDSGPVILQARVPVLSGDDPDRLAARVLEQEHKIYPLAIRWFAEGRVALAADQVLFDGQPLAEPRLLMP